MVISNCHANQGKACEIDAALRPLAVRHPEIVWMETQYHGHAVELAKEAGAQGFTSVVAMGGDGTVHQVVNGLMHFPPEHRPSLGIIPAGSGNDFAESLRIPAQPEAAFYLALNGGRRAVDIARISSPDDRQEYWTNTLGIGFDAIVNIRSRAIRYARGFWVYFLAALQTILFHHKPMRLQAVEDGRDWEKHLLMLVICNGRREGGAFLVAPQARQDDGLLDYLAVKSISRPMMLYTIPFVMNGTHARLKHTQHGRFARLELHSDRPLTIHTDGEIYAGLDSQLYGAVIEVIPSAVRAIVPPSKRQD